MGNELETRGPGENFRDISYSEISLPFRDIPEDIEDKLFEVDILLEEYINTYFDENSINLDGALNISEYEVRSSIFRDSFMIHGEQRLRLLRAVEASIRQQVNVQSIDVNSIFGIAIRNGILSIYYGNRSNAKSLEIDLTRKTVGELYIHELTKSEVDELEEETLTEQTLSVVGGVSITLGLAASSIYGLESRTIRRIRIAGVDGNEILLEGRFRIPYGESITEFHVLDILERNHISLDPENMSFIDGRRGLRPVPLVQIERQLRGLQKLDFIERLRHMGIDTSGVEAMSDADFDSMRNDMGEMFREIRRNGGTSQMTSRQMIREIIKHPRYAKIYLSGGLLVLGLDAFSGAFADPDDLGSYVTEAATIAGFSVGMMGGGPLIKFLQGARIGRKIPTGAGKVIGGIGLGFGVVFGGNYVSQKFFDVNNNFTREFPDREDWMQKYGFDDDFEASRLLNTALGGFMYTAVDGYEGVGQNLPDLPWFDTRDGLDTFLYNSSINLGTDPIEYFSMTHTRDIAQWNRRAEIFRENALIDIKSLIEEYRAKDNNSSDEVKQDFMSDLLKALGTPEGASRYVNMRVYDRIMGYFSNNDFYGYEQIIMSSDYPIEDILTLISHELGKLEIDDGYREDFREDLDFEKMVIEAALSGNVDGLELAKIQLMTSRGEFSRGILSYDDLAFISTLSEAQRNFLRRLTERMYNRERLIEEGFYVNQNGNKITKQEYFDGAYRNVYTGSGEIPPGMIRVIYQESEDEQMWEYFTQGIDEESFGEVFTELGINSPGTPHTYRGRQGQIITQEQYSSISGAGRRYYTRIPGEEAVTVDPSQLFFRFFDRIVEVKKSEVYLENITTRNSGRAWESDGIIGETEELTGMTRKDMGHMYFSSLSMIAPFNHVTLNYLTSGNRSVLDRIKDE